MSEADMRSKLCLRLRSLHAKPIENKCAKGTPDVAYIGGWMELKWNRAWPTKSDSTVPFARYTNNQRLWLRKHWSLAGRAFLVLQVKREWLIWAGCDAGPCGYLTREELYRTSLFHMNEWDEEWFVSNITANWTTLEELRKTRGLCDLPLLRNFSYNDVGSKKASTTLLIDGE